MESWSAKKLSKDKIADYKAYNFVDGEGVRCSLYVSGCMFNCPGCYNKQAQNFNYGFPYSPELEEEILDDVAASYCQGLTLLGGEPFLNTKVCLSLVKKLRERFGHTKDIWAWSGYLFEELLDESPDKLELLTYLDILVDGRFMQELKNLDLQFRGSSNQRIIDVQKSLAERKAVLWAKMI